MLSNLNAFPLPLRTDTQQCSSKGPSAERLQCVGFHLNKHLSSYSPPKPPSSRKFAAISSFLSHARYASMQASRSNPKPWRRSMAAWSASLNSICNHGSYTSTQMRVLSGSHNCEQTEAF
eukprot:GHUV01045193.1.p1 GENE.GHUV01045193.1~~GHUV01045193.1.p1  ORF type:complete len:120 (+),score=11.24 GHUV01045193.1:187-546(+)